MPERRPRFLGGGATIAALAIVIALGYMERRSRLEMRESAGWVTHTLQVERQFGLARTLLTEAETGQRGFLLTGDESYLDPNVQALTALPGVFAKLKELTADNRAEQQRVDELQRLAEERLERLRLSVAEAKAGRREAAIGLLPGGRGKELMIGIRTLIQSAINDEEHLLRQREAALDRAIARRGIEAQILIALMAVGLIVGGVLLSRLNRAHMMALREMSMDPSPRA
jgi:CHASE3 domain sensor protein